MVLHTVTSEKIGPNNTPKSQDPSREHATKAEQRERTRKKLSGKPGGSSQEKTRRRERERKKGNEIEK